MSSLRFIVSMLFLVATANAYAAGSIEDGEKKAQVCAGCHGADGNSPTPQFPSLAHQVPGYIAKQLAEFKSGARANAIMAGQVANLSEQDMLDLDAFYASQEMKQGVISKEQEAAANEGGRLYRGGDRRYQIAACMGCHGPGGHGIPTRFPRVAGQSIEYLEAQLVAFKEGTRIDSNAIMNTISFELSRQQIKELALYVYALKQN